MPGRSRTHYRRRRPADLPGEHLQAGRHRRPARRLRVLPLRQPDPHRARGVHRRARGRRARLRLRLRPGRRGRRAARAARARRPRRGPVRRLRRHLPAVQPGREAVGRRALRSPGSPTSSRCAPPSGPADPDGLGRDADQPAARHRRHRRDRRGRPRRPAPCSSSTTPSPRPTCSSRSRSAPTSSCTRRRSTSAATATSSAARWSSPRRHHPRRRVGQRADRVPPERDGRRRRAVRRLARAARPEDPRGAHGAALRQRRGGRRASSRPTKGDRGALPRPARPPRPRGRRPPDEAVRRHGRLPGQGRRGRRHQGLRRDAAVDPRGVARRRRVAHRAPRPDDARLRRRHRRSRCPAT